MSTDLYIGDPRSALERSTLAWPALERSLMLRVAVLRIKARQQRAAAALALAHAGDDRERLLRDSERDARRIAREKMPWSDPLARLLHAGIAATRQRPELAIAHLDAAIPAFESAEMALYAAAAQFRRGALVGGDLGRVERNAAAQWMSSQGIANPDRMLALIAPGFS